jgi:hypothetical protein
MAEITEKEGRKKQKKNRWSRFPARAVAPAIYQIVYDLHINRTPIVATAIKRRNSTTY